MLILECNKIKDLRASRKTDRDILARVLIDIAAKHGAQIERRDEPRNAGFHGAGIHLTFSLNGVGAMLDIDDLHGGDWALIHWFNSYKGVSSPARYYSSRFNRCVGATSSGRPHHKATSHPGDWYSVAIALDAGLLLAARGEAFDPIAD
jgi:hypothetical protein